MSTMTAVSVKNFLSNLRKMPIEPAGKLERSEAPKIQAKTWTSFGKKKDRLCLDDLNEDCFKVATCVVGCFLCCGDYERARVTFDGHSETVWVNINSMVKRFDLPRDVILGNLSNLGKIVRLVQEKRLLQAPSEESVSSNEEVIGIPLLLIRNEFPSLIPLERIAKIADEQGRCFRLSKRCYHLVKSIDVYPGGFIAIDTGKFLGAGANGRVKISTTLQGVEVARRAVTFSVSNLEYQAGILRFIKILNEFKGKTGILDTLAMGVYENKKGRCKFVSFHPLYDQNLNKVWKNNPSEKDRLKMAHELLQGLNTIAEKGMHRDLSYQNIFLRTTKGFEAVIGDLELFQYHEDGIDRIANSRVGPEKKGIQREVWDLGTALYYVLQSNFTYLPWNDPKRILIMDSGDMIFSLSKAQALINQENLDKSMASCNFPPELESLLRGMLALDPNARWTARQSLEHFEKYLASVKQVSKANRPGGLSRFFGRRRAREHGTSED